MQAPLSEALVEQAPDAVIFADAQGVIRVWNPRAEQVFGYSVGGLGPESEHHLLLPTEN